MTALEVDLWHLVFLLIRRIRACVIVEMLFGALLVSVRLRSHPIL